MEKCYLYIVTRWLPTYSTACTVLSGKKGGDNFKVLPIATVCV
ncbi:hypothetical protein OCB72_29605 [Bacillus cereus]|nr:hypothetical protein [Bacillus cereus]